MRLERRGFDGTRLRFKIAGLRTYHCGTCGGWTRHACWKDALGFVQAKCRSCGKWNQWVG